MLQHGYGEREAGEVPASDDTRERFRDSYHDLKRVAARRLSKENSRGALTAAELVHEAFLRLRSYSFESASSGQFIGVVARVMRRILVDRARYRRRAKRGNGECLFPIEAVQAPAQLLSVEDSLDLGSVFDGLRKTNPRAAAIVEWRAVHGMGVQEIAKALGISKRTVHREWIFGLSWLEEALGRADT